MKKNAAIPIQLIVNDEEVRRQITPDMNLLQFLRMELGLKGTKNGCETGHCGSCSVILDGKVRRACLVKMKRLEGAHVETIEGLSKDGVLHPLQQAFIETGAVQCGFCTPGMIMAGKALLDSNPNPNPDEIKAALTLNRNLCRCTGYVSIIEAIQLAARRMTDRADEEILPTARHILSNPQLKNEYTNKVTGSCLFSDDIEKDGMLYGKILWAAHPHAKILNIDISEAQGMEGVALVITAKDIPGKNQAGLIIRDQPAIAEEKTRYIGDSIASVFAETAEIAEKALTKVKVDYEVLPAVFSPQEASKPDAPKVHEAGNLVRHAAIERGDVDKAFSESAVILEDHYTTPFIEHAVMEPESGLAYPDGEGGVVLARGKDSRDPDCPGWFFWWEGGFYPPTTPNACRSSAAAACKNHADARRIPARPCKTTSGLDSLQSRCGPGWQASSHRCGYHAGCRCLYILKHRRDRKLCCLCHRTLLCPQSQDQWTCLVYQQHFMRRDAGFWC